MILLTLIPWSLQAFIFIYFGWTTGTLYLLQYFWNFYVESQNYFSHYGLTRNKKEDGTFERVKAHHSWNSDHLLGRILLFELTRHSDHHFMGAKPYQILESKSESPLLPYGYPAMLILGYFPFLFKPIMARQLEKYSHLN